MAKYGIPYMGSKSSMCDELIKVFPKADNFYDLFGGGFSVTHAMILKRSKDYKEFHFNELRKGATEVIQKAINGDYAYDKFKPPFVTRDDFYKNKDKCLYTKIIWSFGNNGQAYIFSEEIEPYKCSMHNAVVFNKFDDLANEIIGKESFKESHSVFKRRLYLRKKIESYRKTKIPKALHKYLAEKQLEQLEQLKQLKQLERLQQLQQLERLEQLQQLERLERLERLFFYNTSYEKIKIKENSIVYCDPPYRGTAKYDGGFNHSKFLDWAASSPHPVFISEYNIKDTRFKMIYSRKKRSLVSAQGTYLAKTEKVYANNAATKRLFNS